MPTTTKDEAARTPGQVMLPLDDPKRSLNDSALPSAMIWAGGEAYDSLTMLGAAGQSLDLDSCSLAVGIYRAMTEAYAKEIATLTMPTSPAPASPGVPDSLRALSEAATQGEWYTESEKCDGSYGSGEDCGEGYLAYSILTDAEPRYGTPGVITETSNSTLGVIHEESDEDGFTAWDENARANTAFIVAAVNFVRTLLSAHPAGQSAGSGANSDCTFDNCRSLKECQRPENCDGLRFASRRNTPAPDSTRTGDEGTDDDASVPTHILAMARAMADGRAPAWEKMRYGSCVPQHHSRSYWVMLAQDADTTLAARPAAPEAQGAWRELAATEIDAIAQQWGTEGDADGRAYAKTLAAIIRAEHPAPPTSSGQGGR